MQKARGNEYAIKFQQLCAGGLIGVSLVFIQNFGGDVQAVSLQIAAVAFAVALPFLGGIFVLAVAHEEYPYGPPHSLIAKLIYAAYLFGSACATIGVCAALWHILHMAGVAFALALVVASVIYSIYVVKLEKGEGKVEEQRGERVEGELQALRQVVLDTIQDRFPDLMDFAQSQVPLIKEAMQQRKLIRDLQHAADEVAVIRAFKIAKQGA